MLGKQQLTELAEKYSIEKIMELSGWQMLMSGITGVIDLGGTAKDSVSLRDRVNKGEVAGPRMVVAGPLVCRQPFGGFPAAASAVITSPEEGAATVEKGGVLHFELAGEFGDFGEYLLAAPPRPWRAGRSRSPRPPRGLRGGRGGHSGGRRAGAPKALGGLQIGRAHV